MTMMLTSAAAINAASAAGPASPSPYSALPSGKPGQTVFGEALRVLDLKGVDNMAMSGYWQLVNDIVNGAETMRARHSVYLPKFPNEEAKDYQFRWENSKFTNVYRDVVENLASKPFEQEVTLVAGDNVTIPEAISKFIEDVDGSGNQITAFAVDTFFNGINNAIDWIWVDHSTADDDRVRSVADEKALGLRPYWTHVLGANVLEARSRVISGKETLVYMRILEHEEDGKYVRILRSDGTLAAWESYKQGGDAGWTFIASGAITINKIPMVPFITGRRKGRSFQFLPVMKDAAELQVELYQQESGLKNLETLSGFPMLAGNGVKPPVAAKAVNGQAPPPVETLRTGPSTVLYGGVDANGVAGSWEFIAPPAEILKFLLDHIKETVNQLRELGRNPLTAQSGNLTVVTAATAAKKGNSAVQMWAFGLKDALENALVLTGEWLKITKEQYDPMVNVFTDFEIDGQEADVSNLVKMRENRDISLKTFWHEMQRRGVLSGEFDAEVEEQALLDDLVSPESEDDDLTNPPNPANDDPANSPG